MVILEAGRGDRDEAEVDFTPGADAEQLRAAVRDYLGSPLFSEAGAGSDLAALRAAQAAGQPGPEGFIAKLQTALNKAVYEFCVDLAGPAGLLIGGYTETAPELSAAYGGSDVRKSYLWSLANSMEGGTSEVMRNILGDRVLGLPGELRVDRDIPWREARR